jgi:hypothetical protein
MPGFHHILFPIDFSDRCRAVGPFVNSLAERFDARLTLMHVVQIPAGWYGGLMPNRVRRARDGRIGETGNARLL